MTSSDKKKERLTKEQNSRMTQTPTKIRNETNYSWRVRISHALLIALEKSYFLKTIKNMSFMAHDYYWFDKDMKDNRLRA